MHVVDLLNTSRIIPFRGRSPTPNAAPPSSRHSRVMADLAQLTVPEWFASDHVAIDLNELGFNLSGAGGVHLSKTMMLAELTVLLDGLGVTDPLAVKNAIIAENRLGKRTEAGRRLALANLQSLYGIANPKPLQLVATRLWRQTKAGRELLALLCALAREPLLRQSAGPILESVEGASIRWPDFADAIKVKHPDRYSKIVLNALARHCASSWTQSGHLRGHVDKRRRCVSPSPPVAAYAALLGSLAGYGGPTLLRSPWMRILDCSENGLLSLLRQAEGVNLARIRSGGGILQIDVRGPMAETLEVPEIVDRR